MRQTTFWEYITNETLLHLRAHMYLYWAGIDIHLLGLTLIVGGRDTERHLDIGRVDGVWTLKTHKFYDHLDRYNGIDLYSK